MYKAFLDLGIDVKLLECQQNKFKERRKKVKEVLKCKCYVRYCDDFCLFSNDKEELKNFKYRITDFLDKELKLTLSKCDIFPVSRGVDFMGYRHFRGYNFTLRFKHELSNPFCSPR